MNEQTIVDIVNTQREFFDTGVTKEYSFRIQKLKVLQAGIKKYEDAFHTALHTDLRKPAYESYMTETGFTLNELSSAIKRLKKWMKPKRVPTPLYLMPAKSSIHYAPLGVNLIISPYNYPIALTLAPLIAAIAAGNTIVVKASELSPSCSAVLQQCITELFDPEYIAFVPGEIPETTTLLNQKFDHVFFTGSPRVGSIVMQAAAKKLTPVTLELGGKSPCIVHSDAHIKIAAKRIVFGKFLNAGQSCVAPDYVMVHDSVKEALLQAIQKRIREVYGDPKASPDFARIINDQHFKRICGLINKDNVVCGGDVDASDRYIAPTVLSDVNILDPVMGEEIFGPVLPVLSYSTFDQIYKVINVLPSHPLACYIYTESSSVSNELIQNINFGGGCINNCMSYLGNEHLPFGGVGESGMGSYHGLSGFKQFSHGKSILHSRSFLDLPLIYPPYKGKLPFLKKILK
ncbi:MAG: aldehyde dehydrogenase [Reichenbachiella sp.]